MSIKGPANRVGEACLHGVARGLGAGVKPFKRLLRGALGPLLRDDRGSALIEFAFVGPPFLLLMAGIIEVSVMFFTGSVIEGATKEAARQIRTGQIQGTADPVAAFQSGLCDALYHIIDCSKVVFNVQTFSSFEAVSMPIELDKDGNIVNTSFSPGSSGAVTVVRAMYRWNFITPLISSVMPAGLGGHLLISTVAFQNEPYNVN